MNIILADEGELNGKKLSLHDRRAEHIVKILKAEIGDTVRVGEINGGLGTGIITHIKKKFPFQVDLEVDLHSLQGALPPIDLILALPRPIMLRRILSQITALGVGTIHLINANRVEKSFWGASILEPEEYRSHLVQGLEQAVDTRLPEVVIHPRFKPFVEDVWPILADDYSRCLVAHPDAPGSLGEVVEDSGRIALAIGPEGGWVPFEVENFVAQGFVGVNIGKRILKVDTAVIALHSRISAVREFRALPGQRDTTAK